MDNLLKAPEAAAFLGIKVGTVYIWTCKRLIPYKKLNGNTVRFSRTELEEWIAARSVAPVATAGAAS